MTDILNKGDLVQEYLLYGSFYEALENDKVIFEYIH